MMDWTLIVAIAVAVGIAIWQNRKHNKANRKLDNIKAMMVTMREGDIVKPPTQELVANPVAVRTAVFTATICQSKAAAQKRLDEDTKRVGFARGEVYEFGDGFWGIIWGGKYPLASQ